MPCRARLWDKLAGDFDFLVGDGWETVAWDRTFLVDT